MKKVYFCYLLAVSIIVFIITCGPGTEKYNEKLWKNAFKKQEVLEFKPELVAEFEEVYKRPLLQYIDDKNIYINGSNEQTINIYTRKECRLKIKFGGKGEGPGEFRIIQGFKVYEDFIFINSPGKNSYFSKKGELLKEVRCPPALVPCLPVGDNFITREYSLPTVKDINNSFMEIKTVLVGSDFKEKKILFSKSLNTKYTYNAKTGKKEARLFPESCTFKIYKNNIYIGYSSMDGFFFTVFDSSGNKLYEINRPYIKRKIPDALKDVIRNRKEKYRQRGSNLEVEILFFEYFPSFCTFSVANDKIYVFLYPEIDKQRILILDLKGKLIDVSLIPFDLQSLEKFSFRILYSNIVHNGEKYYIKDNFETSKWELWRLKLCEERKKEKSSDGKGLDSK